MDRQCRGIMMVASILLATTVLTSSATAEVVMANRTNATTRPTGAAAVPSCRRGTMQPKVAAKCWIAILEVPLCVFQIVEVFEGGSVLRVGKACCHAFIDLTDECKIEVFQKWEFFPAIEKFCAAIGGASLDDQAPAPAGSA